MVYIWDLGVAVDSLNLGVLDRAFIDPGRDNILRIFKSLRRLLVSSKDP
jgi:hypothetical protein